MLAKSFEDLEIWKMAREIVKDIYQDFSSCKDFDFRNQINRAGISIMNNIAEGFSRESKKEFHQFLNIAKGSCGEVSRQVAAVFHSLSDGYFHCACTAAPVTALNALRTRLALDAR